MMIPALFTAHAGEVHETAQQSSLHYLETWYVALAALLVVLAAVMAATYWISRKSKAATVLAASATLLVAGVAMYNLSSVVSVVALAAGMALTLGMVLVSLGKS